jgi:hypothetical protein
VQLTVSLEIDRPLQEVVQLLVDPAHRPKWLRGLVLHEPQVGEDGQVGTVSRVVLQAGKQTMEATETITRREPADLDAIPAGTVVRFEREIVADGMWNAARERLSAAGPGTTLWESANEFRFDSLPMRLLAPVLRGTFRKQSLRHMQDFKAFAEDGVDVRDVDG